MKQYALTDTLPAPNWKNRVVAKNGYNSDIIKTLNSQFPKAVEQCRGVYFSGTTELEKARAVYNYLRNGIRYKKDPKGKQLIQLPARMIAQSAKDDKHGADCKSLSLAAAAFLHCQGFKNVRLRYASYDTTDPTPTHVYAVATSNTGQDIIVDPVYKQFNAEAPYKYKKDYKMEISVLSGPPVTSVIKMVKQSNLPYPEKLRRFQAKVRPGGFLFTVLSNEIARTQGKTGTMRYSPEQLGKYANALRNAGTRIKSPFIQNVITKELAAVQSGNFSGSLYQFSGARKDIRGVEVEIGKISLKKIRKKLKKISLKNIVKGVKAVGLIVPRKSFLAMVALNVRGLATRMKQLSKAERDALWKKFGGQPGVLEKAVNNGAKKRPLFGAGKKVKAIKGIGAVEVDDSVGIAPVILPAAAGGGVSAATIATIIAAAAPILVAVVAALKKKGIPEIVSDAVDAVKENPDFPEAVQAAADKAGEFNTYVKQAAEVAQATGVIPDKPENTAEAAAAKALPTDELETTGPDAAAVPGGNTALILGAAAVGAFFLLKKK